MTTPTNARFVQASIVLSVAVDQGQSQPTFSRNQQIATMLTKDELCSGQLAASETYSIPFGKVSSGSVLYIEVDAPTNVMVNGSATPIPVAPLPGATACGCSGGAGPYGRFYLESSGITSITLVNPSSSSVVNFAVYTAQ